MYLFIYTKRHVIFDYYLKDKRLIDKIDRYGKMYFLVDYELVILLSFERGAVD
jgi:hypothetical protein